MFLFLKIVFVVYILIIYQHGKKSHEWLFFPSNISPNQQRKYNKIGMVLLYKMMNFFHIYLVWRNVSTFSLKKLKAPEGLYVVSKNVVQIKK